MEECCRKTLLEFIKYINFCAENEILVDSDIIDFLKYLSKEK